MFGQTEQKIKAKRWGKELAEREIIDKCVKIIKSYSPIQAITSKEIITTQNRRSDTLLEVTTDRGSIQFLVEVKGILKRPLPLNLFLKER